MKYRPEIDGLRALAVAPVILFHAGLPGFEGGFVGVDVFFVISGYLITTILLQEIGAGRFSFGGFYERRARRILPALFLVCLVSIPFAWLWMLPSQFEDFSKSLIAVSLFGSNFYFLRESGYFAAAAEEKPLLHTWSLAVEEQYYVVFPILLVLAWRLGAKRVFWGIVVLALASLIASEWGSRAAPNYAFYLTPTRAWELFAGAIAAFIAHRRGGVFSNSALSLLGLGAIVLSMAVYDARTPFPSLYALLPVGGTVLVILFAGEGTLTAKAMGARVFVGLGLISYSAYLWHQPLFAFARLRLAEAPSAALMLGLALLSVALAWLSWRFVEQPFRDRRRVGRRALVLTSVFGAAGLLAFGAVGQASNGFERLMVALKYDEARYRMITEATDYDMYDHMVQADCALWARTSDDLDRAALARCHAEHGPATVVLGDSHAMNLYNILAKTAAPGFLIGLSQGGCRPHDNAPWCQYDAFDAFLEERGDWVGEVVFHQSGSYFIADDQGELNSQLAFEGDFGGFHDGNIEAVLRYLEDLSPRLNGPLVWIGPFVEYRHSPLDALAPGPRDFVNAQSVALFEELEARIQRRVEGAAFVRYEPFASRFRQPKTAIVGDCFLYRDDDHYSRCGEDYLARN